LHLPPPLFVFFHRLHPSARECLLSSSWRSLKSPPPRVPLSEVSAGKPLPYGTSLLARFTRSDPPVYSTPQSSGLVVSMPRRRPPEVSSFFPKFGLPPIRWAPRSKGPAFLFLPKSSPRFFEPPPPLTLLRPLAARSPFFDGRRWATPLTSRGLSFKTNFRPWRARLHIGHLTNLLGEASRLDHCFPPRFSVCRFLRHLLVPSGWGTIPLFFSQSPLFTSPTRLPDPSPHLCHRPLLFTPTSFYCTRMLFVSFPSPRPLLFLWGPPPSDFYPWFLK